MGVGRMCVCVGWGGWLRGGWLTWLPSTQVSEEPLKMCFLTIYWAILIFLMNMNLPLIDVIIYIQNINYISWDSTLYVNCWTVWGPFDYVSHFIETWSVGLCLLIWLSFALPESWPRLEWMKPLIRIWSACSLKSYLCSFIWNKCPFVFLLHKRLVHSHG